MMTQGMVCHETYRDTSGEWLLPDEVGQTANGEFQRIDNGSVVTVGRTEKMSKSKKNVVDPETIIQEYGADTARLFMLSDSPPNRDLEWTTSGIEGAWKYINRLWRMVSEPKIALGNPDTPIPHIIDKTVQQTMKFINQTIAAVGSDLDQFRFNKAVARIRELTNSLEELNGSIDGASWAYRHGMETVTKLISPMMPHLAEEMWKELGQQKLIAETSWPDFDPTNLEENTLTMAVQVNGKMRGTIEVERNISQQDAETLAFSIPAVQKLLDGRNPRKVIFVSNKIVNFVV